MEALSYDLIVIGAGPAGSSAAIAAARAGARVLLLERGQFPRHKVCGEFVSAESLGLLATLIDDEHRSLLRDAIAIPSARIFLDGRVLKSDVQPAASSIARFELDSALWSSALNAGIDARQHATVSSIAGEGPFRVATSVEEFEGRALINTTGRWSNLNRHDAIPEDKWIGLKAHYAESSPPASVDLYFFQGGYCGVQPVGIQGDASGYGRVNAAAMVRADVATTLPEMFEQHPQLLERSNGWRPLTEPVSTSPLVFRDPRTNDGDIILAGDAAGFVDPFVGDGISLALRSGALAAESLVPFFRGETDLASAVGRYGKAYRGRLAPVFRASSTIRRLLTLPKPFRIPLLFALENSPAVTRYLVRKTR